MKIFICWSGEYSKAYAVNLKYFVNKILQYTKPFISPDTRAGELWRNKLADELKETSICIACITPDNIDSEWIHFETGAVSSNKESIVVPLLIDVENTALKQTLSAFMTIPFNKEGLKKLIFDIHALGKDQEFSSMSDTSVDNFFEEDWTNFEKKILEIPKLISARDLTKSKTPEEYLQDILSHLLASEERRKSNYNYSNNTVEGLKIVKSIINVILCNVELIENEIIEFDIYLHNRTRIPLFLHSFQCGIDPNPEFVNGGNLKVEIIHSGIQPFNLVPNLSFNSSSKQLRLTVAVHSTKTSIIPKSLPGLHYCRIRITNDFYFNTDVKDMFVFNHRTLSNCTRTSISVYMGDSPGQSVMFNTQIENKLEVSV